MNVEKKVRTTKLYEHQTQALKIAEGKNRVAFYWDMGLGKTFGGSEKMKELGARVNLVICQKSKVNDWLDHFEKYYPKYIVCDLTDGKDFDRFKANISNHDYYINVGVINYELAFRRPKLLDLRDFTLMLDESSLIQNEVAKRSKFALKLGENAANVILLSGTPTGGKYENLWSQMRLLGWKISKQMYLRQYVTVEYLDALGRSVPIVTGYKNVDRLKRKMRVYGCQFLKTDDVMDLPAQNFIPVKVKQTKWYKEFRKNRIISWVDDYDNENNIVELVGDTTLTKMLYERQLTGMYSPEKLQAFKDLVESTNDRLIVFYNFTDELHLMIRIVDELDKPISIVNGKSKDLYEYENKHDSITFVQYQAGAMGLNLQAANKIIYFTPPLSSELYEQSKKRIHRIGQEKPCFYYQLIVAGSIEEKIYNTLAMRRDYTEKLFEKDDNQ